MKQGSDWIIVLYNALIHHLSFELKTANDIRFNIMFLSAHLPLLAPVELFFRIIKNEMRKSIHTKKICFNK